MDEKLNARERWPEAFAGLSDRDAWAVEQALVASWHEGRMPTAEHVADLAAEARGELSVEEYLTRVLARAQGQ